MRQQSRLAGTGLLVVALSAVLTGCSRGDLTFSNESPSEVTVSIGDEDYAIEGWGGVSILGAGCSQGDITVGFASGKTLVVDGPVCPDERVVIGEGTVDLQPTGN